MNRYLFQSRDEIMILFFFFFFFCTTIIETNTRCDQFLIWNSFQITFIGMIKFSHTVIKLYGTEWNLFVNFYSKYIRYYLDKIQNYFSFLFSLFIHLFHFISLIVLYIYFCKKIDNLIYILPSHHAIFKWNVFLYNIIFYIFKEYIIPYCNNSLLLKQF